MRRDDLTIPEPPFNDRPGDAWMCGSTGKPCASGPNKHGFCPHAETCIPTRTWAGKRRLFYVGGVALFVAIVMITLHPSVAPAVFKPGELTSPHGQILSSTTTADRCSACHPAASMSLIAWFDSDNPGHTNVSQTDRCLDCHHTTIDRGRAKLAHNLSQRQRTRIAKLNLVSATAGSWHDSMPAPAVDQNNVECSACHREHRGENASLVDLSDSQCQTCHSDRFGSFASSHPDWKNWPYGRSADIAFDHQSHMNKHFPAKIIDGKPAKFDCNHCHQRKENGELERSASYATACASCHEESLKIQSAEGFDLVSLPTIPEEIANAIGGWPANATGFPDGKLAPLTELMLRDHETKAAIRRMPQRDFSQMNLDDPEQAKAMQQIAIAHRQLLVEISSEGTKSMIRRASMSGVVPESIVRLFRTLPPQLVSGAYREWFEPSKSNVALRSNFNLRNVRQVEHFELGGPAKSVALASPQNGVSGNWDPDDPLLEDPLSRGNLKPDPLSLDPLAQDPLAQDPLAQDPLAQDPLAQDPLAQDPLAQDPLAQDPLAQDPLAQDPLAQDPLAQDPLAQDPLAQDPLAQDPLAQDPLAQDPLAQDPLAQDPLAQDPLAQDPLAQDPLAQDPLAQDPLAQDPLAQDPLAHDPLSSDPLAIPSSPKTARPPTIQKLGPTRFDPREMLPMGGWYRDDLRMSISYRGGGHEDPIMRSAVEILAQLPRDNMVRQELLKSSAIKSCLACHPSASTISLQWRSQALVGRKNDFTKFAHKPHMTLSELRDCTHCHKVSDQSTKPKSSVNLVSSTGHAAHQQDFLPLRRSDCVGCHQAKAAGDSCVKCHRYHIGQ